MVCISRCLDFQSLLLHFPIETCIMLMAEVINAQHNFGLKYKTKAPVKVHKHNLLQLVSMKLRIELNFKVLVNTTSIL